jgi:hypothetical protein
MFTNIYLFFFLCCSDFGRKAIHRLVDAMDSYLPLPQRPLDKPFLMPIEDVFAKTGRGTIVTGKIEQGISYVFHKYLFHNAQSLFFSCFICCLILMFKLVFLF